MPPDFNCANKGKAPGHRLRRGRLAHDGVTQLVFKHYALAVEMEPIESAGRADPVRSFRSNELNFAPDSRRVQQAEPCGVEPQKTAGPAGAQAEILRVEANSSLIMIADANGERFGDRAIRQLQR